MNLSSKALFFLMEAIDFRVAAYDSELASDDLDEDDRSDVQMDRMYLLAIREDLQKAHDAQVS